MGRQQQQQQAIPHIILSMEVVGEEMVHTVSLHWGQGRDLLSLSPSSQQS